MELREDQDFWEQQWQQTRRSAPIYEHNSTVSFKLPEALDAGVFDRLLSDDLSQLTTYFRRVSGSNTDALF